MTDENDRGIEEIIRKARESGAFDNLPGKGKPLRWEDESMVPEDQRMTNRILRENGYTLDWIALGQDLDRDYEKVRARLAQARQAFDDGRLGAEGWNRAREQYVEDVRALNRRVIGYNLRVPSPQLGRKPYPVDPDQT